MDENPTELMAEFQKLRQETSGLSQNLMARAPSVDARRSCCSNTNKAVLKVMDENFEAMKKQSEVLKTQQDAQNKLMKELLEELRSVRNDIVQIMNKQEEDREEMEDMKTIILQIQETLKNPKIVNLCGNWILSRSYSLCEFSTGEQIFYEEDNMLIWSYLQNGLQFDYVRVRIGSNKCKIREDGKIEISVVDLNYKLEVKEDILTIEYKDTKAVYERSS